MPVTRLPDAELLVTRFLRNHPDVTPFVGARVSTELPPRPVIPAVTLTRIGGVPSLAGYLDEARLEISAWGRTKGEAEQLARTVEAAMLALPGTHVDGTVTYSVQEGVGLRWNPDDASDTPRYTMVYEVYIHP